MINKNAEYGNINHQYVGARYVPKFFQNTQGTAEWVANVPYEALTIVTYLGNSYTSKIPVPSGIGSPNNNPTYWAMTGAYNEQVELYRAITEQVATDILTKAPKNSERRLILIGDSYAGGNSNIFGRIINAGIFNQNIIKKNEGGSGFINTGNFNHTFLDLLNLIIPDIQDPQNITDIVVGGGYNDVTYTQTDLYSSIVVFLQRCRSIFPNATLWGALCAANYGNLTIREKIWGTLYPAWSFAFSNYGVFLDGCYNAINTKSDFNDDNFHPSESGGGKIGAAILSGLLGESHTYITSPVNLMEFLNSGISHNGEIYFYRGHHSSHVIANKSTQLIFETPITVTSLTTIILGTTPPTIMKGTAYIPVRVGANSNDYSGLFTIQGNNLQLLIQDSRISESFSMSSCFLSPVNASFPEIFI